jgi:hypothetical protein
MSRAGHDDRRAHPDGRVHDRGVIAQQGDGHQRQHAESEIAADEQIEVPQLRANVLYVCEPAAATSETHRRRVGDGLYPEGDAAVGRRTYVREVSAAPVTSPRLAPLRASRAQEEAVVR